MGEYSHMSHMFLPVYDENSEVLILGSFPSVILPSTSPANAACSLEKLVEVWREELRCQK